MQSLKTCPIVQVRTAASDDVAYVVDLHKKLAEFLGFIPRQGIREHLDYGHILIAETTTDGCVERCGYIIHGAPKVDAHIFQLAVPEQRWRTHIGRTLTSVAAEKLSRCGCVNLRLNCRDGIAANGFWARCGFSLIWTKLGGHDRRKMVNVWQIAALRK